MKQPAASTAMGAFLRARRGQLTPAAFGLPAGARRRTPGLRREEVAQLCGISTTWLAWIEQGRIDSVSVPTLIALAKGLKLSRAERQYLFGLAAKADPAPPRNEVRDREPLQRLVDSIRPPAYILGRHWDAVVWNAAALRLFPAWLGSGARPTGDHRNLLHYVFLDPIARRQVVDWKRRAQRLVAEFRADTAVRRVDPIRDAMVRELTQLSSAFSAAWQTQAVQAREGGERRFRRAHSADRAGRGVSSYQQMTLRLAHEPDLKLVVLCD
jgi:transcriptional regulator with XRE-family HTH domain